MSIIDNWKMLKDVLRILIYEIFLEIFLGKREKQLILTHKSGTNITLDNLFFVKKKKESYLDIMNFSLTHQK